MAQNLETGLVIKGLSGDTDTLKVNNSIDTNTFLIKDNLNVGINQSNPTEKLEVSGKTKTETIQITSGATNIGSVLTLTDNLGNSEWRQITGVSSISGVTPISSSSIGSITTLSIDNSKADDITKGAASFNSSDFNDNNNGLISIDYVNAQKASGTTDGFLSSSDWNKFNNKQNDITLSTNGTSGLSTLTSNSSTGETLNIPIYGGIGGSGFGHVLCFGCGPTTINDNIAYVFGSIFTLQAVSLSNDRPTRRARCFKGGQVISALVVTQLSENPSSLTPFATPQTSKLTISVYNVTTNTGTTIDSLFPIGGGSGTGWDNPDEPSRNVLYTLTNPLQVQYGDEIQIRMVSNGSWDTRPGPISHTVYLHIL
jgi:hypothetical protein